ncbi:MAG: alkaline phosphatase [Spirochaetes bacterium]|jgi:alkaline phosphatase|nr:alkaline phosphatase [Spirochaetota bacterium]
MRKSGMFLILLLCMGYSACNIQPSGNSMPDRYYDYNGPKPKNIIIMIADGCGYAQIQAADFYSGSPQVYESWMVRYGMSTFPSGGSYLPAESWSDFNHVLSGPTDSAAAATAMSTGVKTTLGTIGQLGSRRLNHLMTAAQLEGYATGVVTSVQWSHATPAGFVAHNSSRKNYGAIALEMLESNMDVIIGCGHPLYDNDGNPVSSGSEEYQYVGGESAWNHLLDDSDGIYDQWTLVETTTAFQSIADGSVSAPERLLGIPRVYKTLQHERSGTSSVVNPGDNTTGDTFNGDVPALSLLAQAAIEVLDQNDSGFVLMIEGGAVDWAGHDNNSVRNIEEELSFNTTVEAVISWVEANSSWDETLLIVTADHESGYLTGSSVDTGSTGPWASVVDNGSGNLPGMDWHSSGHTNQLVPFFAKGIGAAQFSLYTDQADPQHGHYIDNTDIGLVVKDLMDN